MTVIFPFMHVVFTSLKTNKKSSEENSKLFSGVCLRGSASSGSSGRLWSASGSVAQKTINFNTVINLNHQHDHYLRILVYRVSQSNISCPPLFLTILSKILTKAPTLNSYGRPRNPKSFTAFQDVRKIQVREEKQSI